MLMLLFRVGAELWAIATSEVREVVPLVTLQAVSQGWSDSGLDRLSSLDAGRAGLMNYRGETIPVVDISALVSGRRAEQTLSTRIVVVESDLSDEAGAGGKQSLVGLIAAQASAIAQLEPVANIPLANRYAHSMWQSAADGDLVCRLAIERVVSQIYLPEIEPVADSRDRQLKPSEAAFQTQSTARAQNNGFSLKGA